MDEQAPMSDDISIWKKAPTNASAKKSMCVVDPKDTPKLKIIHAGFHRAGSSSLALMLDKLGFGTVYHCRTFSQQHPDRFGASFEWWRSNDVLKKLNNGREDQVDFQEWLNIIKCQTVMDFPVSYHWDKVYKQYPDTKVILSVRDFHKWYESKKYFIKRNNTFFLRYIASHMIAWWDVLINDYLNGFHGYKAFGGINGFLDPKNKEKVRELVYQSNIDKAKRIVPAKNLLIYDIKDGYEPLCAFLNVPLPEDTKVPRICDRKDLTNIYDYAEQGAKEEVLAKLQKVIVPITTFTIAASIIYKKLSF